MKTKIEKLQQAAAAQRGNVKKALESLCNSSDGTVATGWYTGSGRHTKAVSVTNEVADILRSLNIAFERYNDAPRGGVGGEKVRITSPAVLADLKRGYELFWAKQKALREAAEAAREVERERIEREAELLAPRLEISDKTAENLSRCKTKQSAIWYLGGRYRADRAVVVRALEMLNLL